ncbi:hypothetical protein [Aeromicrobium sp.]|uniref:hypothetical protein n=1 Tax=Aeromicrobium sp. TaxID=1871063 RepID=UPI0025C07B69|nr:hypothetical protein [Aeromicrobium sp.]MCK5892640.1 hypothetical protein [Aeromicrobium sp.]
MIDVPVTSAGQEASWHALLDLHDAVPEAWVLVGGQMVHVHAAERGYRFVRPTDDADAVLDVKLRPTILHDVTAALVAMGFTSAGVSPSGIEHRWNRGEAQIDVLVPQGLGERLLAKVVGVSGSPTVETPAGQTVVDHAELVDVRVGSRIGFVRRPTLLGSLIAKAAADTTVSSSSAAAGRHLEDFVALSAMLKVSDFADTNSTKSQRRYVSRALERVSSRADLREEHPDSRVGLARLARWAGAAELR